MGNFMCIYCTPNTIEQLEKEKIWQIRREIYGLERVCSEYEKRRKSYRKKTLYLRECENKTRDYEVHIRVITRRDLHVLDELTAKRKEKEEKIKELTKLLDEISKRGS